MAITDYQLIQYIQGVSGAYINSEFKPTRYTCVSGLYRINQDAARYMYGVTDGSSHNYSFRYSTDGNYAWRHGNTSVTARTLSPLFSESTDILCSAERTSSPARITLTISDYPDATSSISNYFTTPTAAQTSTKNMFIMAHNNNGSAAYYAIDCRLYWIDIRSSSALPSTPIFYGVPVREKTGTNPKVGLYDTVSDTVFWSATSTNFVAGPDIVDYSIYVKVPVSITDLTGTVWRINANPTLPSSSKMYNLSFYTGENMDISCTRLQLYSSSIEYYSSSYFTVYSNGSWNPDWYRGIHITGGISKTDSDLIDWLLNNATLISGNNFVWKPGIPYVNINGTWKKGIAYVNVNGTWKVGIE